ncbi:MAG: dephospho-CoA kinase [Flavobacteriales bacterium]|nr:dephospho-CoA kinase [Flavobacteriales bacterium]
MKIIGLTGGIGSGKSTVCRIFEVLNVPVFYADDEAKALYESAEVVASVTRLLGHGILNEAGKIDRKKLAALIFEDAEKLLQIQQLIHPLVKKRFEEWKEQFQKQALYCIREAAILIESGSYKDCDKIIVVTAPEEIRIQRVMKRDKISRQEVLSRMTHQMQESERLKYADFVINNDGSHPLIRQVMQIHHQLLAEF